MTSRRPHTPDPQRRLLAQIRRGEDSVRQFKLDVTNPNSLAAEIVAFANGDGGTVFIGVSDDGATPGLSAADVSRVNQLVANVASQAVRSPIAVQTRNVRLKGGRIVVELTVPKGLDKPYFDRNGMLFVATVQRVPGPKSAVERATPPVVGSETSSEKSSENGSEKSSEKILARLAERPTSSAREVALALGLTPRAVEKQIAALKAAGRLRRIGSAKAGRWEVLG
jgi:predicted HTH transcriptional regulator